MWHLENTYHDQLPAQFYSNQSPTPVEIPEMVYFNKELAKELHLDKVLADVDFTKNILSGKAILDQTNPIAQAYAGHQFGHFNMLGDGRAVLLGEHVLNDQRFDIQLKGSGETKFSRRGDGRATLYSMLREYLMSEAMHSLGISTTRSLAVVKTGEPVYREQVSDGAVLTRVAKSHIRVGTFEYARVFCEPSHLEIFTKYVMKRHFPDLLAAENYALELLKAVMNLQMDLLVDWMRVGFIHGVMNTDNMSISGETIDYGPCAFMNTYDSNTVYSSIDHQGRYAFGNQPAIAHWNLSVLANALLPLIDKNQEAAVELAKEVLNPFREEFIKRHDAMMHRKLGIVHTNQEDGDLIKDLFTLLTKHKVDYTNFFISLKDPTILLGSSLIADEQFINWQKQWELAHQRNSDQEKGSLLMSQNNPRVIPRNHLVEEALNYAAGGNFEKFDTLIKILSDPYSEGNTLQVVPSEFDLNYQTFCGT